LSNIHRPGALTPAVVLSLGLGLTLLTTLMLVDGNLRRELSETIPAQAPSFYFLGVQDAELPAFLKFVHDVAPEGGVTEVPLLRGRITTLAGVAAADAKPSSDTKWMLEGDRGLSYAALLPASSTVVAGSWWPAAYEGPPLVSVDAEVAKGLGIGLGDTITVTVLGRDIEARIANLREVKWLPLAPNFALLYSPGTFRGAPHIHLAMLTLPKDGTPEDEAAFLRAASAAYPTVTAIRVKEAIDRVDELLGQIVWAILAASSITLITAVLVLAGALAAAQHQRLYDAVVLKTLGATRRRLVAAFGLEYLLLGLATAIFGILAGSLAAWFALTQIMRSSFVLLPDVALATTAFAVAITVGFGLAGTWRVLGAKVAPVLRNL
jgi:putative ABC transport system permease protein